MQQAKGGACSGPLSLGSPSEGMVGYILTSRAPEPRIWFREAERGPKNGAPPVARSWLDVPSSQVVRPD
jgi:hypothetical protein